MKFLKTALLGVTALETLDVAYAIHFPTIGRPTGRTSRSTLSRRGDVVVDDIQDVAYYMNITLGGDWYTVQLDTGR